MPEMVRDILDYPVAVWQWAVLGVVGRARKDPRHPPHTTILVPSQLVAEVLAAVYAVAPGFVS